MVRFRTRPFRMLVMIGLWTLVPATVVAQDPWTVTVVSRLNPVPVGYCAPIQITVLDPSTRDVPRNALGVRVTIANFDMAVNGASVVGQQVDASHWSVCACQGGVVGTAITVTATYPALSLPARERIPGVAFQRTGTLLLAPPNGTDNPIACSAAANIALVRPRASSAQSQIAATATSTPTAASPPTIGQSLGRGSPTLRKTSVTFGPVTVNPTLAAQGNWFEPGAVTANPTLSAQGFWFEPGPVTVTLTLSAAGNWIEP